MTVKEKRGRRRYIGFSVDRGMNKTDLITRFKRFAPEPPYVVQCGNGYAIVRCSPTETYKIMALMKTADPSSESLMTSGTLKALKSKVPGLIE